MPHMPDYNCTPPKGGSVGKTIWVIALIFAVVIISKTVGFIEEYFVWFATAASIITASIAAKYGIDVWRALHVRTWKMKDASVMSKYERDKLEQRYAERHALDGGPVIRGELINGSIRTESDRAGTTGLPSGETRERSRRPQSRRTSRQQRGWPEIESDAEKKPGRPEQ